MPQIVAAVMPAPLVPVELREFPEPRGSEVSHFLRAQTYALSELNPALADAEAMRLPKALVRPS